MEYRIKAKKLVDDTFDTELFRGNPPNSDMPVIPTMNTQEDMFADSEDSGMPHSKRPRISRSTNASEPTIETPSGSAINTQDDLFEGTAQHCKRVTKRFEKTFIHYIKVLGSTSVTVQPTKWPAPEYAKVLISPRYCDVSYWCTVVGGRLDMCSINRQ